MSAGELAPCLGIIEAVWQRVENQAAVTANDGNADALEIGDPFWKISVRVNIKNRAHFDLWDAFFARRQLHNYTFTMHRTFRPNPRDPLITSDTGLTLSAISAANSTVSFTSFGNGRTAYEGDMISYKTAGDGYWIGMVTEETTADGSGNITIPVWPRPVTQHATTPAPRRIQALGEFRLTEAERPKEGFKDFSFRFEAEQVLR